VKLYHRTSNPAAILDNGFADNTATKAFRHGVWFANSPLDAQEGGRGWTVLSIEVRDELLAPYEEDDGVRGYRYFLIPAAFVNQLGAPAIHDDDFAGCSRKGIEAAIAAYLEQGRLDEAEKRTAHLTFLEKHKLLGRD
jgi:hypothetical protein